MLKDNDNYNHAASYRAYLLRLWREDETDLWRATLEDAHSGQNQHFANLEGLFQFLTEQTGGSSATSD